MHVDPISRSREYHRALESAPRWYDTYFVDLLREMEGNPGLDIVWMDFMGRARPVEPEEAAACPHLDGSNEGVWALVTRTPMLVRSLLGHMPEVWGVPVVETAETLAPTSILFDGMHGLPMIPGPWLFERLAAADRTRHNTTGALANQRRRERVEAEFAAQDAYVHDVAKDGSILREFAVDVDREGGTVTREDEAQQFRLVEQWQEERAVARARRLASVEQDRIEVEAGR